MKAHLDFETRSDVDLRKQGLSVYARSKHTDILCAAFAFDKGPVEIWKMGEAMPFDLISHIQDGGEVLAHNAPFEWEIWHQVGVRKYGWPVLPIKQLHCTMATAYTMSLPGSLENLAPALGIDQQKDMQGSRIMLQLSKPREVKADGTIVWWEPSDVPEKFETLYKYCMQDVEVERSSHERMMDLSPSERSLWLLDHKINQRGIQIDIPTVKIAIDIIESEKKRLDLEMRSVTNNGVATASATGQLKDWLEFNGVLVEGVAKGDIVEALKLPNLPSNCKRALQIRQEGAKSSTAKLTAMILRAGEDFRVRGIAQYHGAGTGRWAGRGIQVQNLPRPTLKHDQIEEVIKLIRGEV
jgi:DNA polymerase